MVVIKIISMNPNSDDAVRNMEKQIDGVDCIYSEAIENIREIFNGTDMVFLIGATDDNKLNEISDIASELNILTIAVVTKFLSFDESKNITQLLCDDFVNPIASITNLIVNAGMINVDLYDIRLILLGKSTAISSSGSAVGENRAKEAIEQALDSPLFRDVDLKTASGVLVNIAAESLGFTEFDDVGSETHNIFSESDVIRIGMSINPDAGDVITVSVVVAGF